MKKANLCRGRPRCLEPAQMQRIVTAAYAASNSLRARSDAIPVEIPLAPTCARTVRRKEPLRRRMPEAILRSPAYPMRLGRKPIAIATMASITTTRMAAANSSTSFSVAQSPRWLAP